VPIEKECCFIHRLQLIAVGRAAWTTTTAHHCPRNGVPFDAQERGAWSAQNGRLPPEIAVWTGTPFGCSNVLEVPISVDMDHSEGWCLGGERQSSAGQHEGREPPRTVKSKGVPYAPHVRVCARVFTGSRCEARAGRRPRPQASVDTPPDVMGKSWHGFVYRRSPLADPGDPHRPPRHPTTPKAHRHDRPAER
jgi:hypothetical protein